MSRAATNISQTSRSRRSTLVAITAAIIGIIYGYDLGNISGALLFIPAEFHLSTFEVESVATVVVVGSIVGVLLGGLVANVIVASFFLSALTSLGGMVTFIILVVFAVIAWLIVWWLAPETKGRPLEAIRIYWENGAKWPDERKAA